MTDNLDQIAEEVSNRLCNLKASGQIDDFGYAYGIDQHGITFDVIVVRKGVGKKINQVYSRKHETIVKDLFDKIKG